MKWIGLLFLIIILIVTGCSNKNSEDQLSIEDEVHVNDARDMLVDQDKELTVEGLKELLLEASAVELKTTDNQVVGRIEKQEEIVSLIEEMFTHPVEREYPSQRAEGEVIGPINFYFINREDIYGLMRSDLIYLEGYYFLLNARSTTNLGKRFEGNLVKGPATSE